VVAKPENVNAPLASVVVVEGVPEGSTSVTVADGMPFDVPTCKTFPFNVNGGVCVVVVVVDGVGDVALGLQPTIAPQRAMTLNTRRSLMKGISESNVPSTTECRADETVDIRE
jgi:hypothetical protein